MGHNINRRGATLVTAALAAGSLIALGPATAGAETSTTRQGAYAAAASKYGVPESVLLAVSYLQSRWDTNAGSPSTSAGYGPMHLTDVAGAVARGSGHHHGDGSEDPRGKDGKPFVPAAASPAAAAVPAQQTLDRAAQLTGLSVSVLRGNAAANIAGGAAVLADHQRALGATLSADPASWYDAVARYGGSDAQFADEVFAVMREGAARTTDDGQAVRLPATAVSVASRAKPPAGETECPRTLACEWIPAPYQKNGPEPDNYGNHDKADRPRSQKVEYIVVHDTEETYARTLELVQNPKYVSWQYTIRSSDGHVAQHVKHKDVAWQAGNWYINSKSIGIEHEGFLAQGGTWYTEAMYRSSAKLVRYLAQRHGVPLDREHIIGHDNVPGTVPARIPGMHEDPGPYWNWSHYFDLMGAPLRGRGGQHSGLVMIKPDFDKHRVPYTGCDKANPGAQCPAQGSASVMLRAEPRADAPLVKDKGKRPPNGDATMSVYDHSARASTGQIYAVAGRQGDWTAIWYLGQKSWFHNPASQPTAVPYTGFVVTPKADKVSVPLYGRAYPEKEAYPQNVPYQDLVPYDVYTFAAGQRYAVSGVIPTTSEYYHATTFDYPADHVVVRGKMRYYQVQFGHRVMFVNAADVTLRPAAINAPT